LLIDRSRRKIRSYRPFWIALRQARSLSLRVRSGLDASLEIVVDAGLVGDASLCMSSCASLAGVWHRPSIVRKDLSVVCV